VAHSSVSLVSVVRMNQSQFTLRVWVIRATSKYVHLPQSNRFSCEHHRKRTRSLNDNNKMNNNNSNSSAILVTASRGEIYLT